MKRSFVASLLLAMAVAAQAARDTAPAYKEDAERFGQPSVIVAPEYPARALREGRGAIVEISGRVSPLGELQEASVVAVPPADEAFAAAVLDVLKYWRFYVPTDDQCRPDPKTVINRVEFSAADGKPHVAVVRLASPKPDSSAIYRAVVHPEPAYPEAAIQTGLEANVFARVDVAEDGRVVKVEAKGYAPRHSPFVWAMETEVEKTLGRWRFPPPDGGKPWQGCYTFRFRLHG